jgi:two-component system, NtrC family, sensor kinase
MKCPRCQQDNPSHASFCLKCGAPLGGPVTPAGSYADPHAAIERLRRVLGEALEQQTATSEILRVISQSPTDVQPVFDAIVKSALRLCDGVFSIVGRFDGELIHFGAHHNFNPDALAAYRRWFPRRAVDDHLAGRALLERRVMNVADVTAEFRFVPGQQEQGFRSVLFVPMVRDGVSIGVIGVSRLVVGPFPENQVELLQTFADQAVIAIENVRLFTELQEKNGALADAHAQMSEALEQQTATSEILRVISSSPTQVQPVFDAIASSATRLCDGLYGLVFRFDGEMITLVADYGSSPERLEVIRSAYPAPPGRGSVAAQAILERRVIAITDAQSGTEYPHIAERAKAIGYRSILSVPMLCGDAAIGAINVVRLEPIGFTDTQVELLKTFADQAVIAIENVRLFTELEAKNRALTEAHWQVTEALEQQTATSEILGVISQSPIDVQPVLDTIAACASRLCSALYSFVFRFDGEMITLVADHGAPGHHLDVVRSMYPAAPGRSGLASAAVLERHVVAIADAQNDDEHPHLAERARVSGYRAVVSVPMLRGDSAIGAINVVRGEAIPFTDKQIALLQTFADQAVIAIENVRLFKELEARNLEIEDKSRQLEVASQHKSEFLANMSHELRTPLNAVIGFSEVLTERMFGELNEKQDEYLKDIYASGQHLLSLINDILDLSKIEAGRVELELADFQLPQAIENALVLVRERALRRGITLEQSIDPRLGEIQGDERKIKQVLLNLLSNAIKFTPEGGRVGVRAEPVDEHVEVAVSDTGVGIAPEDHEAVFEEFRQVGAAEKRAEGTGLGLALARKFIELHGGRIWLKSQVGVGSTFTFTLPVLRGE